MKKTATNIGFYTAAIIFAAALCLFILLGRSRFDLSVFILAAVLCTLLCAILLLAAAFRNSIRKTIYSYMNIGLIGGIFFLFVLAVVIGYYFILSLLDTHIELQKIIRHILEFPRNFSYFAVFFIVIISILLAISNIALIRHEGLCLNNMLSLVFAALYLGGSFLVYFLSDVLMEKVFIPSGVISGRVFLTLHTVIPLFLLLMLCYFECILAGTAVMGYIAAKQKPDHDKDYIIILGCSIDRRGGLLPLLKGRVNRAIRFAWEQEIASGKPLKYVPSGGQGENEIMSEGSAMELYLKTRGAEDYEVFPEKKSVNTDENFRFSKQIIDDLKPDAKIAFATTNYHMLRSGILARNAGIDAQGIAGDTKWYFWPNGFIREFFGILALEIRSHIFVAAAAAILCAAIGCLCYFGII